MEALAEEEDLAEVVSVGDGKINSKNNTCSTRSKCFQKFMIFFTGKRLLLSEQSIIKCPRCSFKLRKAEQEGVTIDVCDFCGGIWLDKGEMSKLIKSGKTPEKKKGAKK